MSVCPSVRMNAEISKTIRATILGLGMQIPEIPAHRKFVSAGCHSYSNAHKPPKPVAPTIFMLDTKFYLKCIVNTYRLIQKKFDTTTLTPITLKPLYHQHNHILRSRVGGAFQSPFADCISQFPCGPFS